MSAGIELGTLLDAARVERLRRAGALVLDVDDTLLARERAAVGDSVRGGGGEETFNESAAAMLLPELLRRGFRVGLITGHGWRQLERRLVAPVVERLREAREAGASIARLSVYANRGATKIVWDGERHAVDAVYGERHQLRVEDAATLRGLLESLGAEFDAEVSARREWYAASFPRFDFTTLPPRVDEREGAVLVLRPIPARRHAAAGVSLNPRAEVYARGLELLRRAHLGGVYELAESGRSSIEITRRGVSKETALRDLLAEAAKAREAAGASGETARSEAASGEAEACVESALVYVGDEFEAGGNDAVIPRVFPRALCLSVAPERDRGEPVGTVVSLARAAELGGAEGTAATHALLTHLLNLSA
jgi:hydroxymethylpyrimidine pyrophosphatase-like HAD family hydrolase